jgi:prevent-host-death family protein
MKSIATVGACDAKIHLSKLLERVAGGESIAITRYGQPVALLIPPPGHDVENQGFKTAVARWREVRKGVRLNGLRVRHMIDRGRR